MKHVGIRDPIGRVVDREENPVRNKWCVWVCLLIFGAVCSAAQRGTETTSSGEEFVGVWSGHWDGAGSSGGFELTLEKGKDGVTGKVSVTGEPTYKANFKSVSFDGKKMSAKYDFPPSEEAEVVLALTFDAKNAKGSWSLQVRASGSEVAAGTVDVTKQ